MRIQNNIMAMNTHRMYTVNNNAVSKSAEKLSSGYRVNRAGDDAAGLAISEKMRAQIRGLNMASKNSQDAVSLVQTAEGALQEVHSMLQRMNELAVQSASGTNDTGVDRAALQQEFENLQEEIDQIAMTTTFNDMKIMDGSYASGASASTGTISLDISGATSTVQSGDTISFKISATPNGESVAVSEAITLTAAVYPTDAGEDSVTVWTASNGQNFTVTFDGTDLTVTANEKGVDWDVQVDLENVKYTQNGTESDLDDANVTLANGADASKGGIVVQVGAEGSQVLAIHVEEMTTQGLKVDKDTANIATQEAAAKAITATRLAINKVSTQRAELGAMQNRLEHKISNLDNTAENLSAAESRIRDVDMAKEMTNFTKQNILSQAATAMLAQANAAPQGVLSLLQ